MLPRTPAVAEASVICTVCRRPFYQVECAGFEILTDVQQKARTVRSVEEPTANVTTVYVFFPACFKPGSCLAELLYQALLMRFRLKRW